jgi:hypothetical protein
MTTDSTPASSTQPFGSPTRFIYGTTRLGDDKLDFADRVTMARAAMATGVWFHTSHTYGNALQVLRAAFDQDRAHVPKLAVKLLANTRPELETVIRQNLEPLAVNHLELGQLCFEGELAVQLAQGGLIYGELERLKKAGRVQRFVLEVFPWTSDVALAALRGNHFKDIVDGCILYLNPLQRFASNELWRLILERNIPVIALRTVAGGDVHRLRDVPGAAWKPYLQQRATEVAPIFEQSGIKNWTQFCVRFAFSFPQVRATVGATARPAFLDQFMAASRHIEPLPGEPLVAIERLQERWADETDAKAERWSM